MSQANKDQVDRLNDEMGKIQALLHKYKQKQDHSETTCETIKFLEERFATMKRQRDDLQEMLNNPE
jgi:prefoldin subunit 5